MGVLSISAPHPPSDANRQPERDANKPGAPGNSATSQPSHSDATLIGRFQLGDRDAATALFLRYAQRLEELARKKTAQELASRFDAEDVVQSVFRTFFRRAEIGQYQIPEGDEIWKLLLVITLNKLRRLAIHHRAQKRSATQTVALSDPESYPSQEDTHEQSLSILQEMIDSILAELPEVHQQMIRLRIDGESLEEISGQVNRSRRTVERVIQQFRQRLRIMLDTVVRQEAEEADPDQAGSPPEASDLSSRDFPSTSKSDHD